MKELYSGNIQLLMVHFSFHMNLNGMGLKPLLPEVMGGFTAGLGISSKHLRHCKELVSS